MVDLEDSIPPARKIQARDVADAVIRRLDAAGLPVFVRVNSEPTHLYQDLMAVANSPVTGVLLPKAETAEQVHEVSHQLRRSDLERGLAPGTTSLALLLESPKAVLNAAQLAACEPSVVALVFGSEDYATAMGVQPTLEAMRIPANLVGLAARAYGLAAWGVAGSIAEFTDLQKFRAMAGEARNAGYTGAFAIHPNQVSILNEVFGISDAEEQEALAILAAFAAAVAEGKGAVALNGKMLDLPVVERARQIVAKARR